MPAKEANEIVNQLLDQLDDLLKKRNSVTETTSLITYTWAVKVSFFWLLYLARKNELNDQQFTRLIDCIANDKSSLGYIEVFERNNIYARLIECAENRINNEAERLKSLQNKRVTKINIESNRASKSPSEYVGNIKHDVIYYLIIKDKQSEKKVEEQKKIANQCETNFLFSLIWPHLKSYIVLNKEYCIKKSVQLIKYLASNGSDDNKFYDQAYEIFYEWAEYCKVTRLIKSDSNGFIDELHEHANALLDSLINTNQKLLNPSEYYFSEKYIWNEGISSLTTIRKEINQQIIKIESQFNIIEENYRKNIEENYRKNIEDLQNQTFSSMKSFYRKIFQQIEDWLGVPPVDYSLLAMGSIARGDLTLYSDIECFLLLPDNAKQDKVCEKYFHMWIEFFEYSIASLGENNNGIHLDRGCYISFQKTEKKSAYTVSDFLKLVTFDQFTSSIEDNRQLAMTISNAVSIYDYFKDANSSVAEEFFSKSQNYLEKGNNERKNATIELVPWFEKEYSKVKAYEVMQMKL